MQIAVASGKGGTGKTILATNLAWVTAQRSQRCSYLDCDVEEPNGALFLKPTFDDDQPVNTPIPSVRDEACTGCGQCGEICRFSAIVSMNRTVLTFPELCHGCGGCWLVCPSGAIGKTMHPVGRIRTGWAEALRVVEGELTVGQAITPPVIRAVKASTRPGDITWIDCPPGTSCAMIEAVRGADHVLLVTEPTPFGLNDLKLAVETVRILSIPFSVMINRSDGGLTATHEYCQAEGIAIQAEIPDLRPIAETYSRGDLIARVSPSYRDGLETVLDELIGRVRT
jgi:MinD superfamily P-loop ATPase